MSFWTDLILERPRAGGDEDTMTGQNRGHQIRECLADAGAGLGHEGAAGVERLRHPDSQLALTGPRFESVEGPRHQALVAECVADAFD